MKCVDPNTAIDLGVHCLEIYLELMGTQTYSDVTVNYNEYFIIKRRKVNVDFAIEIIRNVDFAIEMNVDPFQRALG